MEKQITVRACDSCGDTISGIEPGDTEYYKCTQCGKEYCVDCINEHLIDDHGFAKYIND